WYAHLARDAVSPEGPRTPAGALSARRCDSGACRTPCTALRVPHRLAQAPRKVRAWCRVPVAWRLLSFHRCRPVEPDRNRGRRERRQRRRGVAIGRDQGDDLARRRIDSSDAAATEAGGEIVELGHQESLSVARHGVGVRLSIDVGSTYEERLEQQAG